MSCWLSNYKLSALEVLQSFVVSEYGLRHLKEAKTSSNKCGHRAVAVLEFCPVIGPLATLLEGLIQLASHPKQAKNLGKVSNATSSQNGSKTSKIAKDKLEKEAQEKARLAKEKADNEAEKAKKAGPHASYIKAKEQEDQWKLDFKKNVLNPPPISRLSEADIQDRVNKNPALLLAAYNSILSRKPPGNAITFPSSRGHVFKLPEFPGLVIKAKSRGAGDFSERVKNMEKGKTIIAVEGLNRLHTPNYLYLKDLQGTPVEILIEEELPIAKNSYSRQEELYEFCNSDPQLKAWHDENIRQLTIFICMSDFADVKFDNIPLLSDGSGVGMFDIEDQHSPEQGIIGLPDTEGSIMMCAHPDQFDLIEKTVQMTYEELYKKCDFTQAKERRREELAANEKFDKHCISKQYVTGKEPLQLNPKELSKYKGDEAESIQLIFNVLNNLIGKDKDDSVRKNRRVIINASDFKNNKSDYERLWQSSKFTWAKDFMENYLKELVSLGVIHQYKKGKRGESFIVEC